MVKGVGAVVIGAFILGSVAPMRAATETVTGKVIDLVCYTRNKANTGDDHDRARACALACVKWEGQPVGLLTADGRVYQVTGGLAAHNNAGIVQHLAHTVTVTGDVSQKDGMTMIAANDLKMVSK
jgi:hypothetical protein